MSSRFSRAGVFVVGPPSAYAARSTDAKTPSKLAVLLDHRYTKPADWRRASATGCSCADCKTLVRFLEDATQESVRLPMAQHRRDHLKNVIRHAKLDVRCTTHRQGSPHTLVCTKTQASFDRERQAHAVDMDNLARIGAIREALRAGV